MNSQWIPILNAIIHVGPYAGTQKLTSFSDEH